ncbi:MAG: thioredoxin domain-containing protein [Candidatus Aenigmarchaeota archaeon]|nr:thioredoxin domain-containing protein [Candidatus Aenigmarchaeota archaeon]
MVINWLEWSKEAFERAKSEKKPVLLDIYGVWCHWCHEMDRTYEDSDVVRIINENFIPVRADTDKRPDINERYNQGGWPSTVFLTDEGKIITGATYLRPREMRSLLLQVSKLYEDSGSKVEGDVLSIKPKPAKKAGISDSISAEILEALIENFDIDYGGVGFGPKFPLSDAVELAFLKYRKTKDKKLLKFATMTLDGIIGAMNRPVSGLLDNEEGGFFRYSVSRDWSLPHYEKMLETNAGLLINCLHAYQITADEKYRKAAEKTIGYIKNYLSNPEGGFYGSQDADGEDAYYGKPIEGRRKMEPPFIDKTIYTNLSSLMAAAFLEAYLVLDIEYCKEFALRTVEFLLQNCYDKDKGMLHYYNGKANISGLATDNIYFMRALLDCSIYDKKYLEHAEALARFLIENLKEKGGAFFDRIKGDDDIGQLRMRNKPINDNSVAAECFLMLAVFTGDESYKKIAEEILEDFSAEYKRYGIHAAGYALAIENFIDPVEIAVAGMKDELLKMLKYFEPRKIIVFIDLEKDRAMAEKKGYTEEGVYVCHKMACNKFVNADEAIKYLEGK